MKKLENVLSDNLKIVMAVIARTKIQICFLLTFKKTNSSFNVEKQI